MRSYLALLLLFAVAAGAALAWQGLSGDPGLLRIDIRGWRVETTVIGALALLLGTWLLVRLVLWLLRAPVAGAIRLARRRNRERLRRGSIALMEGRWSKAEKQLAGVSRRSGLRLPALLGAARAAHARGRRREADSLLELASGEQEEGARLARVERAELLLNGGDASAAEALLRSEAEADRLSPVGLILLIRALRAQGESGAAREFLPALRKSQLLDGKRFDALEALLTCEALRACADAETLHNLWRDLPRALSRSDDVVLAYATRAHALGEDASAAAVVESRLKKQWNEALAGLYGRLDGQPADQRLRVAEGWLKKHASSPALLVTLGHLCRKEQIWGKAEDYLRRAQALGAGADAWEELAAVHADQGDTARALICLRNSVALQRGAGIAQALPQRLDRGEAASEPREARSDMGLPHLEGNRLDVR
ncbi:MAG TPA: heme biosynthesis HemY N-terminal domain-containing protein [Xanthomonadaceae bacterium]|nr:heme biosynthesis HemY N-terminal domain-containing protein [Xanthomonadaceae bacterium]